MKSRDLYAACTGMFAILAVQQFGVYLARPTLGTAVSLVAFTLLFMATMVAHVTVIVTQRSNAPSRRPTTRDAQVPKRQRRPLAQTRRRGRTPSQRRTLGPTGIVGSQASDR